MFEMRLGVSDEKGEGVAVVDRHHGLRRLEGGSGPFRGRRDWDAHERGEVLARGDGDDPLVLEDTGPAVVRITEAILRTQGDEIDHPVALKHE